MLFSAVPSIYQTCNDTTGCCLNKFTPKQVGDFVRRPWPVEEQPGGGIVIQQGLSGDCRPCHHLDSNRKGRVRVSSGPEQFLPYFIRVIYMAAEFYKEAKYPGLGCVRHTYGISIRFDLPQIPHHQSEWASPHRYYRGGWGLAHMRDRDQYWGAL